RWWRWSAASAAPPPNTTSRPSELAATLSIARACHAASSGGAALFFDPDLNEAPDIRRHVQARKEPFQGIQWKLFELPPRRSVQDRLQHGHDRLGRTIHVHEPVAPVPR